MLVGILTGGGDCPGLNAVIRAVVRRGTQLGHEFTGIRDGWKGIIEPSFIPLSNSKVSGILSTGGTILGTSRTNPFKKPEDVGKVIANVEKHGIGAIVAIGGDDTLGVAAKLGDKGVNCVGVPKTIDNDLSSTDFTFGFNTAVSIVTDALDKLRTTTEAHHRVMIVEVMGRHAGWIAVYGGIAGGADAILIPELSFDVDDVCNMIKRRRDAGKHFSLIVVAEGAHLKEASGVVTKDKELDAFGNVKLGGIGEILSKEVEKRVGVETRYVVLGHLQRGGSPSAYDRILATRYGVRAAELVHEKKFGMMVALQGNDIVDVSLKEATGKSKTVDMKMFELAKIFFD